MFLWSVFDPYVNNLFTIACILSVRLGFHPLQVVVLTLYFSVVPPEPPVFPVPGVNGKLPVHVVSGTIPGPQGRKGDVSVVVFEKHNLKKNKKCCNTKRFPVGQGR